MLWQLNFNDPCEHISICSCGHSCLRVWVGGFVLMVCHGQFSSLPKRYPTQNCPWGGVKENSPAGIAIPTIPSESELLPEWTKLKLISGPRGHLRSKQTLNPRPKRSKKAKGSIIRICKGFSISRGILFQSFLHVKFLCWSNVGFIHQSFYVWGFCVWCLFCGFKRVVRQTVRIDARS